MPRASVRRRSVQRSSGAARAAALAAALSAGAPAQATVYEIGEDNSVIVHDAPRRAAAAVRPAFDRRALAAPATLQPSFQAAADSFEISAELIEAVAWVESRFRQNAVSPAGARGIMQLMPATARELGVDAHIAHQNIRGGSAYLRRLLNRYAGDVVRTLAAYNAGPAAVDRYGGVPPFRETQAYVQAILARLASRITGK